MDSLGEALAQLQANDPILAGVMQRHKLPELGSRENPYHSLVRSIISQQISVHAAASIRGRFLKLFDNSFPSPEAILTKSVDELRAVGLSRPKANYMLDLASKLVAGSVRLDHLHQLSNEEILHELTSIKGIGEWTAQMFLMFTLGRLDVLPAGDVGIQNGIARIYQLDAAPTPKQVRAHAKAHGWDSYESVACWYVWEELDNAPNIVDN